MVQSARRSALEDETVRVVEEAVEDGVAEGGISDDLVPVFDRDLAGEQRAAAGIAVVEYFQEIVSSLAPEGSEPPVVEDEKPSSGEPLDELRIGAVRTGEGEFVEQTGDAVVAGRDADAAGLVAEGTGEITLPRSGGAADEDGLAVPDPPSGGEAEHRDRSSPRGALKLRSSMVASRWSLAWPLRRT